MHAKYKISISYCLKVFFLNIIFVPKTDMKNKMHPNSNGGGGHKIIFNV